MSYKILIHTAFFAEAKAVVEYFRLQCLQTKPYKIYAKDEIVLVVSGMGEECRLVLEDIFEKYKFKRAINLGVAGCKDKGIEIGSIFCTTHDLGFIEMQSLSSSVKAVDDPRLLKSTLVDMESSVFTQISQKFLKKEEIFILKVVSDHLETKIPKKEFIWKIMKKNLKNISRVVTMEN